MHNHSHNQLGNPPSGDTDRRWLLAALGLVLVFMGAEVTAGFLAHSLALLSDAGHMLTDAVALGIAVVAAAIARRPARGSYTYGFARVDALSGQANGITLVLLSLWFTVEAIRRLITPGHVHGAVVAVVAGVGLVVNAGATALVARANRASLNIRGALAHLLTDVWAFGATLVAGLVVVLTDWVRADAVASLVVAALMAWTGGSLIRAAGRVFLEAAPRGIDPAEMGRRLAAVEGVAEVHDLHIWQIGPAEPAVSAHVLVQPPQDCHAVSGRMRVVLADRYGITHVTLQADHLDAATHSVDECVDSHGEVHVSPEA